ncbi:hypothetical protein MJO29_013753 [Puccinia striiformis f. sp. tritici]|uniref:Phosphatidylglycerol/phosphatidylinositol transfer protein n=3 Tax=Puccinia striiformis TaxID=27350 RepID=A0A0L0V7U2_9BASI|nr:hypothetical protein Pst134EA_025581 [Puccinia striiformis f. sp. tritici]KAI9613119.1 hypothetical protein H4Q26_010397 [Puccinia striiformis f. sp. tritici PST-130]KNE95347.1 hypothetical protein PSTG_11332 [Puccinia striiformis f. sp. tritici PST-78]POW04107.1 hypothetical protein PSTT_10626 [Puccinia striiformis]KAH9443808.1 hypothetical protein Pst134EB_026202 [Puccinia striiformis f. sp. tritici]KAH9451633.1 hypothetical protein Pst134EA_025581 [Puccinia striiformis f. sp. tritici]
MTGADILYSLLPRSGVLDSQVRQELSSIVVEYVEAERGGLSKRVEELPIQGSAARTAQDQSKLFPSDQYDSRITPIQHHIGIPIVDDGRGKKVKMLRSGINILMALLVVANTVRGEFEIINQSAVPFQVQSFAPVDNHGQPIIPPDSSNQVPFTNCPAADYPVNGEVKSMTITPCQRDTPDDPCTFVRGSNYTIQLVFQSTLSSDNPRSSVVATDIDGTYAYSGQSFNACKYATCPVYADRESAYTYRFHTLASSFNHLTFNLTQDFLGPSMFCAGTPILFRK